MATQTNVQLIDDLDGSTVDVETVRYADPATGKWYEADLSASNRETIFGTFHRFVGTGRTIDTPTFRKAAKSRGGSGRSKSELAAIRAWGEEQGLEVSKRGRLSSEVLTAYDNREGVPVQDASVTVDAPVAEAAPARKRPSRAKAAKVEPEGEVA